MRLWASHFLAHVRVDWLKLLPYTSPMGMFSIIGRSVLRICKCNAVSWSLAAISGIPAIPPGLPSMFVPERLHPDKWGWLPGNRSIWHCSEHWSKQFLATVFRTQTLSCRVNPLQKCSLECAWDEVRKLLLAMSAPGLDGNGVSDNLDSQTKTHWSRP